MTFRYRRLDENYDMTFGQGGQNFLVDTPAAVAQSVLTRLLLWQGEWFLDLSDGTPWMQKVLGKPRQPGLPDAAIRARIQGTPYVTRVTDYASGFNSVQRRLTISCKVLTAFGPVTTAPPGMAISPSGALVIQLSAVSATPDAVRRISGPRRLLANRQQLIGR